MLTPPGDSADGDRKMNRLARVLLIFLLVAGGYLFGQIEWLERELMDLRARLMHHPASTDLVLVQIDEPSLREFSVWPWPRHLHAEVLKRLVDAGARQVAFDIDFSSTSRPQDDRVLAQALAEAARTVDIILPVFRQPVVQPDGSRRFLESQPIAGFTPHGRLAAFNVRPDPDGKVRRLFTRERWDDRIVPHYAALIAGLQGGARGNYYVDFSIEIEGIPRIGFADVAKGRFDPALFRGRTVLIGASALQLGDMVPVPIHRALPGSTVQALAYSSLVTGRAIRRVEAPVVLLLLALVFSTIRILSRGRNWGSSLALTVLVVSVTAVLSHVVHDRASVYVDLAPFLLIAVLDYITCMVNRLRSQDIRLMLQSLALRRRDMFMRLIVENSFDAIFTLKPDGEILTVNHAAVQVFGPNREDVIGKNVGTLLPNFKILGGGGLDDLLTRRGIHEATCSADDGRTLFLDMSIGQVRAGEDLVIIVLARDITEKRKAEAEALRSQQYLVDSIESVDAGLAVFDRNDRLVVANRRYLEKPGLGTGLGDRPAYEDVTRTLADAGYFIASRRDAEGWAAQRMDRHRSDNTAIIEQTADDRWILTSDRRTKDGGTIVVETDITALKRREAELVKARDQAESANRTKSEFLAAMSHELRTPLNAIIGFSEMMDRQVFGPLGSNHYTAYAKDIHASGKHLLDIINDILDMAKIEAGQFEIHEDLLGLGEVVNGAARLLREKAEAKRLAFDVEKPDGALGLNADARILRQVLLNLLSNAVKFTPEGGSVSVRARLCDDGSCAISVADTGIGMSQEDLAKALQPFGQVQSSLARSYEGTGLGLPLVSSFMDMHGGRLEIDSVPGKGTTATVVFPAARVVISRPRRRVTGAN